MAADRKIWGVISELLAQSWSLDDALHEVTAMRNDLPSLLQLRPKVPRQPPPPPAPPRTPRARDKRPAPPVQTQPKKAARKGKGKGTAKKLTLSSDWIQSYQGKEVRKRYQVGNARQTTANSPTFAPCQGVKSPTLPRTIQITPDKVRASQRPLTRTGIVQPHPCTPPIQVKNKTASALPSHAAKPRRASSWMSLQADATPCPISWKKAQFQDQINWCGWSVHFGHDTIHLMEAKLDKLRQLENLSQAHKVPRKALEQRLGLLIWATSIFKHLACPVVL